MRASFALALLAGGCFMTVAEVRPLEETTPEGGAGGAATSSGAGGSIVVSSASTGGASTGGSGGGSTGGEGGQGGHGGVVVPPSGTCEALGYDGACVGDTSIWWATDLNPPACRVRDCQAEAVECIMLADDEGFGCAGGTGSTTTLCETLGAEGICSGDDTAVWWDGSTCQWDHCPSSGELCAYDPTLLRHACVSR